MIQDHFNDNFSFKEEAVYKIIVQGQLDQQWSERVGNMQISVSKGSNKKDLTTLIGKIDDQAVLSGILNTLYDLQMTVISVKILSEFDEEA